MSKNSKIVHHFLSTRGWEDHGTKSPSDSGYKRNPEEALDRIYPKGMSEKKKRRWARVCLRKGD